MIHRDDMPALAASVRAWLERRRRLSGDVIGAILAGGRSRRMGADKAALRIGGRPVLPDLAELLGGRLKEVWVVGRLLRHLELPPFVRRHLDLRSGCGPLGGIATALRIAGAQSPAAPNSAPGESADPQAVLAVACDMPRMSGDVIDLLLDRRRREAPASVLRNTATGLLEPLAAVYEPGALGPIEAAIEAGALSVTELLESIGAHVIDVPPELAGHLGNVNTPAELERIEGKR
jgi:molybdopterin-guanine dinucleotide biosynthesis protein A